MDWLQIFALCFSSCMQLTIPCCSRLLRCQEICSLCDLCKSHHPMVARDISRHFRDAKSYVIHSVSHALCGDQRCCSMERGMSSWALCTHWWFWELMSSYSPACAVPRAWMCIHSTRSQSRSKDAEAGGREKFSFFE